jgi:malonyl CoA-acyl carrier protein transacylase
MVYRPAQLLIVTGTPDQIELAQQTLQAIRQKADIARKEQPNSAGPNPKISEPNSGASADPK